MFNYIFKSKIVGKKNFRTESCLRFKNKTIRKELRKQSFNAVLTHIHDFSLESLGCFQ